MNSDYWRIYHTPAVLEASDGIRESHEIPSTGVSIHLDVYPQPDPAAPVVLFNHGAAGYCRLFVTMAMQFHARGYMVVLPDQRGQGLSGGRRGDYTISQCIRNIVDAASWARSRYAGPIFLAGGSIGGALTAYAAWAGAPCNAVSCLDLFDLGNGADGLGISRFSFLSRSTATVLTIRTMMRLYRPLYGLRLPFGWFGAFDRLMDDRDAIFQAQWDADPVPPRWVTLGSLASSLLTPPPIRMEENRVPILVINQERDRMVDPEVTRRNFRRLGGPKRYLEIPYGHWSSQPGFWTSIVEASDAWFREST